MTTDLTRDLDELGAEGLARVYQLEPVMPDRPPPEEGRAAPRDGGDPSKLRRASKSGDAAEASTPRRPRKRQAPTQRLTAYEADANTAFGREALATGSAADIAARYFGALERVSGVAPVCDLGELWTYRPDSGVWAALDDAAIGRLVRALDGRSVADRPRPLTVGGRLWSDVAIALRQTPDGSAGFFECATAGLGFADGFLVGQRLELVPHAPANRCRHRYDFAYRDAVTAPCERWLRALGEWGLTARQQAWLAEWTGVALLGLATKAGKALMLTGEGRNGKSTCMDVITGLFPPTWRAAVSPHDMSERFRLAALAGARINAVADIPARELLDVAALKGVITGDELLGERKHRDPFLFRARAGHVWSCNELPRIADDTDGAWRRLAALPFGERVAEGVTEPHLAERILADERAGIVAWALRAAEGWLARRHLPDLEGDMVDEWRAGANPVALWRAERTADGGWTASTALYEDFAAWARRRGYATPNIATFGARLGRLVGRAGQKRSNGTRYAVTLSMQGDA